MCHLFYGSQPPEAVATQKFKSPIFSGFLYHASWVLQAFLWPEDMTGKDSEGMDEVPIFFVEKITCA